MLSVSGITCTYGRFTCVERIVAMMAKQDYTGSFEHIIYNTAAHHPIVLGDDILALGNIRVINNNIDLLTHRPYTNVGAIRRDSLLFAVGDYYICVDDDDIYLPWNVRQCVDGMLRNLDKKGWKPKYSLFTTPNKLELAQNTLEASFIVDIKAIRECGFRLENGSEHLSWYTALGHTGQLKEDDEYSVPGYSYNWSDSGEVAGHKQSGNMGDPNNFENHKMASQDHATRPLHLYDTSQLDTIYQPYFQYFRDVINGTHQPIVPPTYPPNFHPDLIKRYVQQHLS